MTSKEPSTQVIKIRSSIKKSAPELPAVKSVVNPSQDSLTQSRETVRLTILQILEMITVTNGAITVSVLVGENTTVFDVKFPQELTGHILGGKGKHIESLRVLVLAMTCVVGYRSVIQIPYFPR